MPPVNDTFRTSEFLVSEANGYRSTENVTVAAGAAARPAGQVLGRLTAGGNYVPYNSGGADGSQTISGILFEAIPTGATAKRAVIVRDAEVNYGHLTVTGTKATIIAGLNAIGIAVREA